MRDYRKLRVFELAHELALETYRATENFPKRELFQLTKQMRTAALSVPANLVEGAARDSQVDFARFVHISFGSLKELSYYIRFSEEIGFLSPEVAAQLSKLEEKTAKSLSTLIRYLRTHPD